MMHFKTAGERKAFVKNELPYLILIELYKDCRQSARELGKKFGLSHHTIAKAVSELERRYNITYTLNLDVQKLGFTEGRLVTIRFRDKPTREELMKTVINSIFVQEAYLTSGDFDLFLYVVGLTQASFWFWQFILRTQLNKYGIRIRFADLDIIDEGFLPLRNDILKSSPNLSENEKRVLGLLNENSRCKLADLVKKSRLSQMKVIYTIKKLRREGIIKSFSALTQKPDKSILLVYFHRVEYVEGYSKGWVERMGVYVNEDFREITSDYCLDADLHGAYDKMYICTFKNSEQLEKRGPATLRRRTEPPEARLRIKSALIIEALMGELPFHLETYERTIKYFNIIKRNPELHPFGGEWSPYAKELGIILPKEKKY